MANDGVGSRTRFLQRHDGLTVAKALRDYVEEKRRANDGLPLKARTRSDYLNMVEPARTTDKVRARRRFSQAPRPMG